MNDQNQTPSPKIDLSAPYIEPLTQIGSQLHQAITVFAESVIKVMSNFVPAFIESVKPIVEAAQKAYQTAGSPYGDTQEGLQQWLREQNEAAMIQAKAEQERERQWVVDDFRRQVAEKRKPAA